MLAADGVGGVETMEKACSDDRDAWKRDCAGWFKPTFAHARRPYHLRLLLLCALLL